MKINFSDVSFPPHTMPVFLFSTAILKYIFNKFNLPDHWYPKDLQRQGRVDEALAWFPQNLRCGAYFLTVRTH